MVRMNRMKKKCISIAGIICVLFFVLLDSSMELIASSTDDIASSIDGNADIAAFDTDLPAEHNVSISICLSLYWIKLF